MSSWQKRPFAQLFIWLANFRASKLNLETKIFKENQLKKKRGNGKVTKTFEILKRFL